MFREAKKTVLCSFLGKPVEITEIYQIEGTRTCQVEVNPFSWQCSEKKGCRAPVCEQQKDYLFLK